MKDQRELIREEQRIYDNLINELTGVIEDLDRRRDSSRSAVKRAKDSNTPEAYGALIHAEQNEIHLKNRKSEFNSIDKNSLYTYRLITECIENGISEKLEIKVGLKTISYLEKVFVTSWVRPVCRHYIMNNASREFQNDNAFYELKLKRKIGIHDGTIRGHRDPIYLPFIRIMLKDIYTC